MVATAWMITYTVTDAHSNKPSAQDQLRSQIQELVQRHQDEKSTRAKSFTYAELVWKKPLHILSLEYKPPTTGPLVPVHYNFGLHQHPDTVHGSKPCRKVQSYAAIEILHGDRPRWQRHWRTWTRRRMWRTLKNVGSSENVAERVDRGLVREHWRTWRSEQLMTT